MLSDIFQHLDPRTLASAEALGMHARFIVEGYMAGEHRSPFHGFAVEFAQHREYVPGDDMRHLDWKVLGRTERHYIKQYEQETNFVAHLLVDGSESMSYGSSAVTKWIYAKLLATCLGYLILRQRDAVALGVYSGEQATYLPRSDSRNQLIKMTAALSEARPQGRTALGRVLDQLACQQQRRGMVVVISDFLDDDDQELVRGIEHVRFQGHEIIALQILDPHEIEFPLAGQTEFVGLEDANRLRTNPAEIRASYLAELERHTVWLNDLLARHQAHFMQLNTARGVDEALTGYLAMRKESVR
jgi:uncharacterized protein (DUF58 family)